MNTKLCCKPFAPVRKAGGLLIMHLSILTAPLSAGEIPVVPAAQAGLSEKKLAEVDKFMERQVADKKIAGGIVVVSHDGKIGFFHAYGQMDLEAKKPMQLDTIFRIYSMSKAITTAAALSLVDAGKIAVDDPVSKYIPELRRSQGRHQVRPARAQTADDGPRPDAAHRRPHLRQRARRPQRSVTAG